MLGMSMHAAVGAAASCGSGGGGGGGILALTSAGGGTHVTCPCCSVASTALPSKEHRRPWRSVPGGASQHNIRLWDIADAC